MIDTCTIATPLGPITAAAEGDALVGAWFVGDRHYPKDTAHWRQRADHPVFAALRGWLRDYFAGKDSLPPFRLAPEGTAFQQLVWQELLQIPHGQLSTYGAIAKQIAQKTGRAVVSARAVGGAVGRNKIDILIPCHRVVGANGSLTGYGGGIDRKIALLKLEKALDTTRAFIGE